LQQQSFLQTSQTHLPEEAALIPTPRHSVLSKHRPQYCFVQVELFGRLEILLKGKPLDVDHRLLAFTVLTDTAIVATDIWSAFGGHRVVLDLNAS
jgi:hypothetical protein